MMGDDLSRLSEEGAYDRAGANRVLRECHLPLFAGARRALDLGCGRGAFLELRRDEGITGVGVDTSAEAVRDCRARGLEVVHGDVAAFREGRFTSSGRGEKDSSAAFGATLFP